MPPEDDFEEIWKAIRPNRNPPAPVPELSLADIALLILEARDKVKNNTVSHAILCTRLALKILGGYDDENPSRRSCQNRSELWSES